MIMEILLKNGILLQKQQNFLIVQLNHLKMLLYIKKNYLNIFGQEIIQLIEKNIPKELLKNLYINIQKEENLLLNLIL